eukprot:10463908-Lingulodinium_polyedra.AAC.1
MAMAMGARMRVRGADVGAGVRTMRASCAPRVFTAAGSKKDVNDRWFSIWAWGTSVASVRPSART